MTHILNHNHNTQRTAQIYHTVLGDNTIESKYPLPSIECSKREPLTSHCFGALLSPRTLPSTASPTLSHLVHASTTEHNLLGNELATERSIPAVQTFIKRPHPNNNVSTPLHNNIEIYMLFSLDHGVDGIAGTAHGAIIALMPMK